MRALGPRTLSCGVELALHASAALVKLERQTVLVRYRGRSSFGGFLPTKIGAILDDQQLTQTEAGYIMRYGAPGEQAAYDRAGGFSGLAMSRYSYLPSRASATQRSPAGRTHTPIETILMKRMLALFSLLALAACGSDATTGPAGGSVSGTWNLRTINGSALPVVLQTTSGNVTVISSVLTLNPSGGAYNEVTSLSAISGATTVTGTQTEVGTWFANGGAITFNDQTDQVVYQGSVSGNTLTEIVNGFTEVYSR